MTNIEMLNAIRDAIKINNTIRITTSGYCDRYIMAESEIVARIENGVLGDVKFTWDNRGDAIATICALHRAAKNSSIEDAYKWAAECLTDAPVYTFGAWKTNNGLGLKSAPIDRAMVQAALDYINPSIHAHIRREKKRQVSQIADNERDFIIHHLTRCNDSNQKLKNAGLRRGYDVYIDPNLFLGDIPIPEEVIQ